MPGERAHGKEVSMTKVIFDISMSLDGFVNDANVRPEEPMGDGGERNRAEAEAVDTLGAVIAGRRTYDLGADEIIEVKEGS
jgi:hypothetical protein